MRQSIPASFKVPTMLLAGLIVAFLTPAPPAAAATQVGELVRVINDVRGTPPSTLPSALPSDGASQARAMAVGDGIELDTWLETGDASGFTMTFDPEGLLRVGAKTRLVIDQYQVDAVTGATESLIEQSVGWLRLKLSRLFSGQVRIDTPTATLGAKGTDVLVIVEPDGATRIIVIEGVVTVSSPLAPEEIEVPGGTTVTVLRGQPPTQPGPHDPSVVAQSPAAGGPDFTRPQEELGGEAGVEIDASQLPIDRGPDGIGSSDRP